MADTTVTLSGIRLDNPIIPASGTYGYGRDYLDFTIPIYSARFPLRVRPGRRGLETLRRA